jgi:hypothetical protein
MLNIRTRIWTDLNPSKRIRSRIRSENIRTVFIPTHCCGILTCLWKLHWWRREIHNAKRKPEQRWPLRARWKEGLRVLGVISWGSYVGLVGQQLEHGSPSHPLFKKIFFFPFPPFHLSDGSVFSMGTSIFFMWLPVAACLVPSKFNLYFVF